MATPTTLPATLDLQETPQPLPSFLATILADPMVAVYGDHGFDTKAGMWKPPAVIDASTQRAARDALPARRRLADTKPTRRHAAEWIISLAMLTGGRAITVEDAKARAAAFADMLVDYPAAIFTRQTLQRAAAEFKFFPSFAELSERLDLESRKLKREVKRLEVLAAEPAHAPQAKADAAVKAAVRPMPGTGPKPDKPPGAERSPILSAPPSQAQIDEWAKAMGVSPDAIGRPT